MRFQGIWPLSNVSDKVLRANYNTALMRDPQLYDRYARPRYFCNEWILITVRYIPGEQVNNTQELRDFSLQV